MNLADKNEYENLSLTAHKFLAGVPLSSLYKLELPGGRHSMSVLDIKEAVGFNTEELPPGVITRTLFRLRGLIGFIFGWDDDEKFAEAITYLSRLTGEQRDRSLVPPGKKEGISRVMYCFADEFLAEIINKTVHCFWVMATKPTDYGYSLYMAVYVRRLNWFTPVYMALVSPMLHWIIYPALNKSVISNWNKTKYPELGGVAHA